MPNLDLSRATLADVVDACASLPEPVWVPIFDHPNPRRAATMIPIADLDGRVGVVVTKRADQLQHGGDWVFPGGRVDVDDPSTIAAACRETAEELGVALDAVRVVGRLAVRGPIVTGYVVESFVGVVAVDSFAPDAGEVAAVRVVPLGDFVAAGSHHRGPMRIDRPVLSPSAGGPDLTTEFDSLRHYRIGDDEYLWGMQADILHELLAHLTGGGHDF